MMRQNFELSTCNDALGLEYNLRLHINRPKRCRFSALQSAIIMCIGVFLGFVVCDLVKHAVLHGSVCPRTCCQPRWTDLKLLSAGILPSPKPMEIMKPDEGSLEKLVYVGVMTAEKYLATRAKAVHKSWSAYIPGKVEFFTSAKSNPAELPLVNLPGVDDGVYPPQKKSFMMLKYMHDYHIDDFEWFVRADDDVFIHGDRLAEFLYSLNSSNRLYIGQAGQGIHSEHGLLGLDPTGNYCMGGTTMIFSRATLRKMVPQINFCIKHLVSTHEDVEIGRCVRKFAQTNCPWAFEFRNLFYQNHDESNGSFTKPGVLKKLVKPITMHPVKDSKHLHRMQAHFLDQKVRDLRFKILELHRDMKTLSALIDKKSVDVSSFPALTVLDKIHPKSADEVLSWVFFDKNYYSPVDSAAKRKIPQAIYDGIDSVVTESMRMINFRARELGRHIDFQGLLYGYWRVDPLHSADYITDLLLSYHKHRGKNMKIPVRRHSYLHQPFTLPEVRFHGNDEKTIYCIIPSMGRGEVLVRFLSVYENVCLRNRMKVELIFVNFDATNSADHLGISTNVERLNAIYNRKIQILKGDGEFSRAKALQQGALHCPENALLFFVDLDIDFTAEALNRVRVNTIDNESAYFPIVFSHYDPNFVCRNDACSDSNFVMSQTRGYWRHFGFGIASIYRRDFLKIGGFDLGIRGWGNEDVDFYTKSIKSHLAVFRTPDPGIIHVYHPVNCPKSLPQAQMRMCLGSMRSNLAPYNILSQMIYRNLTIFDGIVAARSNST